MSSVPVDFRLDSMVCIMLGDEVTLKNEYLADNVSKLRLCVYWDSTFCLSCNLRILYQWHNYIDSVNRQNDNSLIPVFVFAPSKKQLHEDDFTDILKKTNFEYPPFVDTTNSFRRMNPQIPSDQIFHTFLFDNMGNAVLVGNPLRNKNVDELLKKVLEARSNKRIIGIRTQSQTCGLSRKRN